MAKPSKKSKRERIADVQKIGDHLGRYDTVVFVENTDIQNTCLQSLRSAIDGMVVVVKKTLFQREYPSVNFEQNYFVVLTTQSELEKLKAFRCSTFLKDGDVSPETVVIKAGVVRNAKLADYVKPVERNGAVTSLLQDFVVCEKGDTLQKTQAKILQIKGERLGLRTLSILGIRDSKELIRNK